MMVSRSRSRMSRATTIFTVAGTCLLLLLGGAVRPAQGFLIPSPRRDGSAVGSSRCTHRRGLLPAAAAAKAGKGDEEGSSSSKKAPRKKAAAAPKSKASPSSSSSSSAAAAAPVPKKKQASPKQAVEAPFFEEALLDGNEASDVYVGDKRYNLMGQSEDVVAPWSVDGFEIDIPDWRPQPAQKYEIVDPSVQEQLGKIENMFGASLRLVSTYDGIWRFLYMGNIRNLIGAEAWTKLLLTEDLKIEGVKEVRFETNYVRDWPDDHN